MATESLPNDSSNDLDNISSRVGDATTSIAQKGQKWATRGAKSIASAFGSVLNPGASDEEKAVQGSMVRQQLANQGVKLASDGLQAVLYTVGGLPGFLYKGLRIVAGDKGALFIVVGGIILSLLCMCVVVQQLTELVNDPTELVQLGVGCRIRGLGDTECAAQGLLTKTTEFAKINTCEAAAERTGKTIDCTNLGVSDN